MAIRFDHVQTIQTAQMIANSIDNLAALYSNQAQTLTHALIY